MKSKRIKIEDFYFNDKECMYNIEAIINYYTDISPETEYTPCFSEEVIDSVDIESVKVYIDVINDYIELELDPELIETVLDTIEWSNYLE